jgi:hypothetical protein
MNFMKMRLRLKTAQASQCSANQRDRQQLDLLLDQEKQPTPKTTASYNVGKTELRLKPTPKNPQSALKLVLDAMDQLLQKRDGWLPTLQKVGDSTSLSLEDGVECIVCLRSSDQNNFIGVERRGGALYFHFPSPDRWVDAGLA